MAYDEGLAERLAGLLRERSELRETRMFGGFGYLMSGNMCLGIHKEYLIVRVGVPTAEIILSEPHVSPMDITGRPMRGWAKIAPGGTAEDDDLQRYCQFALDFAVTLPPK